MTVAVALLVVSLVVLSIGIIAFEVWAFIDAIRNPRLGSTEKLVWCVGMFLLHPFVAIAYYFIASSRKRP